MWFLFEMRTFSVQLNNNNGKKLYSILVRCDDGNSYLSSLFISDHSIRFWMMEPKEGKQNHPFIQAHFISNIYHFPLFTIHNPEWNLPHRMKDVPEKITRITQSPLTHRSKKKKYCDHWIGTYPIIHSNVISECFDQEYSGQWTVNIVYCLWTVNSELD